MKKILSFIKAKKWWLIAAAVIGLGVFWWLTQRNAATELVTVKPEYRDITQLLTVSGRVDAEEKARLSFAGASKLMWLPIKEGDVVKKWQGLAQVDARQLQKQLEIAQNTHGQAFRTFEETLDGMDYYSESGLSESERRVAESSQLSIRNSALSAEIADISVKLAYMSSPIDGIVTRIDQKNVGALMLPTDSIEVVNPKTLHFLAVIDEEDIALVTEKQKANIELDAFVDNVFESSVSRIAFTPSMSDTGGTGYVVWLSLPVDNSNLKYRVGMNGEAKIVLDQVESALTVPVDALIERDGVSYVEVLTGESVNRTEVTTGISDDDYIEITSGLTPDDVVVLPSDR
jgi:HlyD family secretion protein